MPKVDSDGDGLDDETEALIGTSPLLVDTDGDGFSDLLEYKLRNSGFNPLYPDDADCAQQTDREDKDGDGLLNCEERYIGTSLQLADTDADGYSDDLEYRMATNPVIADNLGDLDFDSAPNGFELTEPHRSAAERRRRLLQDRLPLQPGRPRRGRADPRTARPATGSRSTTSRSRPRCRTFPARGQGGRTRSCST